MSRARDLSADDAISLLVPCARCDAGQGEWCATRTGNRASYLHAPRWHDTELARNLAWREIERGEFRVARTLRDNPSESVARGIVRASLSMLETLDERIREMTS